MRGIGFPDSRSTDIARTPARIRADADARRNDKNEREEIATDHLKAFKVPGEKGIYIHYGRRGGIAFFRRISPKIALQKLIYHLGKRILDVFPYRRRFVQNRFNLSSSGFSSRISRAILRSK